MHKHDLEYGRWENYTEVWVCRDKDCDYEERRYVECM